MRFALMILVAACSSTHAVVDAARPDIYEPIDATLAVNGLAFSTAELTLAWPDTEKVDLTAHYTDDATMDVTLYATYTSDSPAVVTMSQGTALPLGPGTATITASYMGQTATMMVTVTVRTLAVASPDGVDFFLATAQGAATPVRSIRGAATTLQHACGLAVLGSELFVADSGAHTIDVWDLAASGDVAPIRQLTTEFAPVSLAANGTAIYVGASDGVRAFDATATGAVAPLRAIAGDHTTIANGGGIAIYQSELYVVSETGSVAVFPVLGNGNITPSRAITGSNTGLASPVGIAVGFGLEIVTDALAEGSVQMFLPASDGNTLPQQAIAGGSTLLATPTSAALVDTMVFVGTPSTSSIEVFPTSTDGESPPTETITGVDVQAMVIF